MRECPACGRLYPDDQTACAIDAAVLVAMGEADPMLGAMVAHYRLTKRLGRGGMGSVYVGEHPEIGSKVAVKVLHRKYAADKEIVERFFNEARAVNLIGHENIVRIFDFGHLADGTPWFIMELLKGKSLSALRGQPHTDEELRPLFVPLAHALGAAHKAGIVHRDLKPDNVFLEESAAGWRVKVLDFGIAKLSTLPGTVHTETGAVLGSAQYMSPEQAAGDNARIGARSDIYSFGVLLYELASGRLPFAATTYGDLLVAHRTERPPGLAGTRFAPIIERCLEKDPQERFATMEEVAAGLVFPGEAPARARSRLQAWALAGLGIAVAAFAILGLRTKPAPPAINVPPPVPTISAAPTAPAVPPPAPSVVAIQQPATQPAATPTTSPRMDKASTPHRPLHTGPRYTIPEKVGDGMIDVDL